MLLFFFFILKLYYNSFLNKSLSYLSISYLSWWSTKLLTYFSIIIKRSSAGGAVEGAREGSTPLVKIKRFLGAQPPPMSIK